MGRVTRGVGTTSSEQYLAKLADKTFLRLWSYPNVYVDMKKGGKGDGKEVCDLLVVFGNHVIVFSDKTISWPAGDDQDKSWSRWYRRAVLKSANQVRGAMRVVSEFGHRLYLDPACTQKLPINLPNNEEMILHGVIVAHGAGEACKEHTSGEIRNLQILSASNVNGEAVSRDNPPIFCIPDVNPSGNYIHVLDENTLDLVMEEMDTITDITDYLLKKSIFVRKSSFLFPIDEKDMLALYQITMNENGEHDFVEDTAVYSDPSSKFAVVMEPGFGDEFYEGEDYKRKKEADKNSYIWDDLIEEFAGNLLGGTSIWPRGEPREISVAELALRHMAALPRYLRRVYADGVLDLLLHAHDRDRGFRAFIPKPEDAGRDVGFFFLTLRYPEHRFGDDYEKYRHARTNLLEIYAYLLLNRFPHLKTIVGVGTEGLATKSGRGVSEDLVMMTDVKWTEEFRAQIVELGKKLGIFLGPSAKQYEIRAEEFPGINESSGEADVEEKPKS